MRPPAGQLALRHHVPDARRRGTALLRHPGRPLRGLPPALPRPGPARRPRHPRRPLRLRHRVATGSSRSAPPSSRSESRRRAHAASIPSACPGGSSSPMPAAACALILGRRAGGSGHAAVAADPLRSPPARHAVPARPAAPECVPWRSDIWSVDPSSEMPLRAQVQVEQVVQGLLEVVERPACGLLRQLLGAEGLQPQLLHDLRRPMSRHRGARARAAGRAGVDAAA